MHVLAANILTGAEVFCIKKKRIYSTQHLEHSVASRVKFVIYLFN